MMINNRSSSGRASRMSLIIWAGSFSVRLLWSRLMWQWWDRNLFWAGLRSKFLRTFCFNKILYILERFLISISNISIKGSSINTIKLASKRMCRFRMLLSTRSFLNEQLFVGSTFEKSYNLIIKAPSWCWKDTQWQQHNCYFYNAALAFRSKAAIPDSHRWNKCYDKGWNYAQLKLKLITYPLPSLYAIIAHVDNNISIGRILRAQIMCYGKSLFTGK